MIRACLAASTLLAACTGSMSAQVLLLDSCQAMARRNYPLVRQYELIEKSRDYTLGNAGKAYLPQVSLTAIGGYLASDLPLLGAAGAPGQVSGDWKFIGLAQMNQAIWDGGATRAQKRGIAASSEVDRASTDVALYELRGRVNQLYLGILLVDAQLAQVAAQDTILANNVDRIRQLTDNGLAYATDLDEIRVEQLKLGQKRTELAHVRAGYVRMLSLLIGARLGAEATLQKPGLDDLPVDAPINRPELSLFRSQRDLVKAQSASQHVSLMPKVGLLGAAVLLAPGMGSANGSSFVGVAGLSASWSIGGLYRNGNEKHLTQQRLQEVDVQESVFRFNTALQVEQVSADIEKQRAILVADAEIVRLRQDIRASYQLRYEVGASSLMDLLNATASEGEARTQQALHEMQLLLALAEYRTTTGNPR